SFLGRDPERTLEAWLDGRVVERGPGGERPLGGGLLDALRGALGPSAAEVSGLPRFTGGAVGYLDYDAIRLFERIPDRHGAAAGPVARFAFYRAIAAFDHVTQRLLLIADAEPGRAEAFRAAQDVLDAMEADLHRPTASACGNGAAVAAPEPADRPSFEAAVRQAKEYIAAGDIFQVLPSRLP